MTFDQKISFIEYLRMKTDYTEARRQGVSLMLDGEKTQPGTLAAACVFHESSLYMKSVSDDLLNFEHLK